MKMSNRPKYLGVDFRDEWRSDGWCFEELCDDDFDENGDVLRGLVDGALWKYLLSGASNQDQMTGYDIVGQNEDGSQNIDAWEKEIYHVKAAVFDENFRMITFDENGEMIVAEQPSKRCQYEE